MLFILFLLTNPKDYFFLYAQKENNVVKIAMQF